MDHKKLSKFISYTKVRENTIKKNTGTRWSKYELNQLKREVENKESYEDIAIKHNRTEEAVRIQVIKHIIKPIITKENKQEIASKYNIILNGIEFYINKNKEVI
tara:strand:- start:1889 stop:2200 length:312 start_codon:yes stop_codon:yes gene_type:complete